MIPRKIFQTWKDKVNLPENFRYWRSTFQRHNPDFEFLLFDDSDNRTLVERHCPRFLEIYDSFPREIFRVDAVRPIYLFFDGGFYIDLDFECIKPLDTYVDSECVLVGRMGADPEFQESLPNAMMASPRFEAFWLLYLRKIAERHKLSRTSGPEHVTGPAVFKECVDLYTSNRDAAIRQIRNFIQDYAVSVDPDEIRYSDVRILPGIEWYPLDWTDPLHQVFLQELSQTRHLLTESEIAGMFGRSRVITYWSHSWGAQSPTAVARLKFWLRGRIRRMIRLIDGMPQSPLQLPDTAGGAERRSLDAQQTQAGHD